MSNRSDINPKVYVVVEVTGNAAEVDGYVILGVFRDYEHAMREADAWRKEAPSGVIEVRVEAHPLEGPA